MTSGIPGESQGIFGLGTKFNDGPFEFALGQCNNRYGKSISKLSYEPGKNWDYSDAGVAILSLLFFNAPTEIGSIFNSNNIDETFQLYFYSLYLKSSVQFFDNQNLITIETLPSQNFLMKLI